MIRSERRKSADKSIYLFILIVVVDIVLEKNRIQLCLFFFLLYSLEVQIIYLF